MLQFGLLALGIGGSIFTAHKIAQRSAAGVAVARGFLPHLVVIVLFSAVNLYLFTLPMAHRV